MNNDAYIGLSTNEEKFKTLLKRIQGNLLKVKGFKKDNQNFRLILNNNGMNYGFIVNFQKSAFNDKKELRFTVNVGRIRTNGIIDDKFKEYDCSIIEDRERLAVIAPIYGYDKWWSITSNTNMDLIEGEMLDLLQNVAFPWFGLATD